MNNHNSNVNTNGDVVGNNNVADACKNHQSSASSSSQIDGDDKIDSNDEKSTDNFKNNKMTKCIAPRCPNSICTLPQIAIKRRDNNSLSTSTAEVVLLNGNWDTSQKIPKIIAEMHNVDLDELHALKSSCISINALGCSGTGMGGKQMKIETSLTDISSGLSAITDTPSPLGSDSGIEGDSADGNLSWLLNYKINELPPVPEQQPPPVPLQVPVMPNVKTNEITSHNHHQSAFSLNPNVEYHAIDEHGNVIELPNNKSFNPITPIMHEDKYHTDKYQYMSNGAAAATNKFNGPKKPPFTYTELIEHALVEKGELTVSGIYQWISDHFPFYKQNDDRWKNSVRHNLSINPHFRKGSKAVHGAGHLWTIAQKEDQKCWQIKHQRMQQFIHSTMGEYSPDKLHDLELATATASIMPTAENEFGVGQQKRLQPQNVAVEYVIDMSGGLGDFLCPPVTKEQVAEECGLGGDYLITDLNPAALGLNISEAEILNGTHLYDDLSFQSYELHGE